MTTFTRATKTRAKARVAITGPAGSGKTYSALLIATSLGSRVAVIDTEHGSASKYADRFVFDSLELDNYHPQNYIAAINAAVADAYEVVVVDSLSHAWAGTGGILELVDQAAARSQSNNSFGAWKDVTPLQNQLVNTILAAPIHIIATMRSKTEYVVEQVNGKSVPRKVGLAPIQRENVEYEFDIVGQMDMANNMIVQKSRCPDFAGAIIPKPGSAFAERLRAWLEAGVEAPAEPVANPAPLTVSSEGEEGTAAPVPLPVAAVSADPSRPVSIRAQHSALSDQQRADLTRILIRAGVYERTAQNIKTILGDEAENDLAAAIAKHLEGSAA